NYAPGKNPELIHSDEKDCKRCHQGGGPIFPRDPWAETSSNQTLEGSRIENQIFTARVKRARSEARKLWLEHGLPLQSCEEKIKQEYQPFQNGEFKRDGEQLLHHSNLEPSLQKELTHQLASRLGPRDGIFDIPRWDKPEARLNFQTR